RCLRERHAGRARPGRGREREVRHPPHRRGEPRRTHPQAPVVHFMKTLFTRALAALLGGMPALVAVAAEAPRRFAAPEVASAPAASGASGIGQVMLALVIVLAAVFAAALVLKRLRGFTGGGSDGIAVLSHAAL